MKHAVALFVLVQLCTPQMLRSTTPEESPEVAAVKSAYGNLPFAVDVFTVYTHASTSPDSATLANTVETKGLRFQLSNFKVGNMSDITNLKYTDLGQYPDGQDIIEIAPSTVVELKDGGSAVSTVMATGICEKSACDVHWTKGQAAIPPDHSIKYGIISADGPPATVGDMLQVLQIESGISSPFVRYCTYTVTATLNGRSRTYDAYFLFAQDGEIAPGDAVVGLGGGALRHLITHPPYPNMLLKGQLADNKAARDFLQSRQILDPTCTKGHVCCDKASLKCGVPAADLRSEP